MKKKVERIIYIVMVIVLIYLVGVSATSEYTSGLDVVLLICMGLAIALSAISLAISTISLIALTTARMIKNKSGKS